MNNIRKERENAGLSVEELSEKLGVSISAIYNWEKGNRTPEVSKLLCMAELFGCTIDYLLSRTDNRDSKVYTGVRHGDTITIEISKSYPYDLTADEVQKLIENLSSVGFDVEKLIENAKK